jgi:hypothetical protein
LNRGRAPGRPLNADPLATAGASVYWRLKSIPELRDLPSPQRQQLWRQAKRDPFRAADLVRLVVILAAVVTLVLLHDYAAEAMGVRWVGDILFVVAFVAAERLIFAIMAQRLRPVLRSLRKSGG